MLKIDIHKQLGSFQLQAAFETAAPIVALFGHSGSGKTSLVNCIAGILRPEQGHIEINGRVLFDSTSGINLPPEQRRIGYVFQDALLFPHLNVERNLLYGSRFGSSTTPSIDAARVIQLLDLTPLLQRRPALLSGGEKQRVAIGRALLSNPQLLLMDEPLASLDGARRDEIISYIELLRDQLRIPIIFVSHSVPEVSRLADLLVLLANGAMVAAGDVHDLMGRLDLRRYTGHYEAGVLIESTVLSHDPVFGLSTLAFDGGQLQVVRIDTVVGTPVRVRVRARDVSLATTRPEHVSLLNVLSGQLLELGNIDDTENQLNIGTNVEARVQVGQTCVIARITRRSAHLLDLMPGQQVYLMIKAVSLDHRSLSLSSSAILT
ncbi:MAG: molybdenum ABC transporter ATP-binding protein [Herbaspirillum sp.]